jgi:hypothetical protein
MTPSGRPLLLQREASEIMTSQIHSRGVQSLCAADTFPTPFQHIFAAFCVLMANSCVFLFFLNLASKSRALLITDYTTDTNQFQREFDSNVAIATQELFSYSRFFAKLTNLLKRSLFPNKKAAGSPPPLN